MFLRNLLIWSLLVLYGIPATLGPHWHRHDSHCSDVCRTGASCDEGSHACDCHDHSPFERHAAKLRVASQGIDREGSTACQWVGDSSEHHCAICQFYSTVVVLASCLEMPVVHRHVYGWTSSSSTVPHVVVRWSFARGPPCNLAIGF